MIKRLLFLVLLGFYLPVCLLAQDTVFVQTLTFDSITSRRGTWQFPENETYRKILMYYTLKCDPLTTQDKYDCGEWDYLTYTNVFYHTGVMDSTLRHQPSYTFLNGHTTDSLLVRNTPNFAYERSTHQEIIYQDTLSFNQAVIGQGSSSDLYTLCESGFPSSKTQHLWTATELQAAGLEAGPISGLKINLKQAAQSIRHLSLKMGAVEATEITPLTPLAHLEQVYFNDLPDGASGWVALNFPEPFIWDGSSNIAVEFTIDNPNSENNPIASDATTFNSSIHTAQMNYAMDLDGQSDFIKLKDAVYLNDHFTFEAWIYKRNNNSWSRLIDLGNGPASDNIIVALSQGTNGKLAVSTYQGNQSKIFTTSEALPLNQWTHIAITLKMEKVGSLYINGAFQKFGMLYKPNDTIRRNAFIGKSNWKNDKYADVLIDEIRMYDHAREEEQIAEDQFQSLQSPATEPGLVAYYDFNEGSGNTVNDGSANHYHGKLYGRPGWHLLKGAELHTDFVQLNNRPQITFEQLTYENADIVDSHVLDSVVNPATQLVVYEQDDTPTLANDTIEFWHGGYQYIYDQGEVIDSIWSEYNTVRYKEELPYYDPPFEVLETNEIARFITPYGINLDLGPQGFTWVYDVTDYAHLLQGPVDFRAGNQQELIDVRFALIKGTPPRDMIKMDRIWGSRRSYSYRSLSDDIHLSDTTFPLAEGATQFKVRTRLTGHGHQSNTGNYPHCCEWKDNTHYLYVNGEERANWHIFQYDDCALNPVYPQGGTWNGSREGWCPGDVVKDFEFEITPYVSGNSVSLDYDITKVPENNQGMGSGNYHIAMHLFHYGPANFSNDVELYDVITPNLQDYYSRKNPICSNPAIVIRNNGVDTLKMLTIYYGVSGGEEYAYQWTGNLAPNYKEKVSLPVHGNAFWVGDGSKKFTARVAVPNGLDDQYPDNDSYTTQYEIPDLYNDNFVLTLQMNHQAHRYYINIRDMNDEVVYSRLEMTNDSLYQDTLNLANGCYTLELIDTENMGLSYWAYPAQGSGYLRFVDLEGNAVKIFNGDFGHAIRYSFSIGESLYIEENNFELLFNTYPNPVSKSLRIQCEQLDGNTQFQLFNNNGQLVKQLERELKQPTELQIDMHDLANGLYFLNIQNNNIRISKKIIKQ